MQKKEKAIAPFLVGVLLELTDVLEPTLNVESGGLLILKDRR